jgi:hypothetical protein
MPKVSELVGQIKGMNQDAPRDSLPKGTVWNLHDILPVSRGANLRGRGQWRNRSTVFPGATYPDVGIFANFESLVSKLLFIADDGTLYEVDPNATDTTDAVAKGAAVRSMQNPVQHRFRVVVPNYTGAAAGKVIVYSGGAYTLTDLPASALTGRFATVFKDRVILGNAVGKEQQVAFSKPGDPTSAWDPISIINTSLPLTALASLRGSVLCFHRGSMERLRGTTPPDSTLSNQTGDMVLEPFPERIGCISPRVVTYWRENVIWCDERGVYMTDGSVTTNLASTGGVSRAWKKLWEYNPTILSGTMYGDFYVISMYLSSEPTAYDSRSGEPSPDPQASPPLSNRAFTFVCDIPTRAWFTMGNFNAATYVATQGDGGEKLFLGDHLNRRVVDLTETFDPGGDANRIDGDGSRVNPILETGWNRLGPTGQKRAVMIYPGYNLPFLAGQPSPPVMKIEMNTALTSPESIQWVELPKRAKANPEYIRARIPVRRMHDGFAFRFSILNDFMDFNLFEIGFEGFSVEQMRVHKP